MNLSEQSVVNVSNNDDRRNSGLSFDSNWKLKLRLLLLLRHAETINSDKLEEEYEEMWGRPMFKTEPGGRESVLEVLHEHLPTKVRLHYVERGHGSANVSSMTFSRKDFEEFAELFKRGESQQDSLSNEPLSDLSGIFSEVFPGFFDQNSITAHSSRSAEAGRLIAAPEKPAVKPICSNEPGGTLQETFTSQEGRISALGYLNAEQTTSAEISTEPNNMLLTCAENEEVDQRFETVPNQPACNSPNVPHCDFSDCLSGCNPDLNSRVRSTDKSSLISANDEPIGVRRSVPNRIRRESQTSIEIPRSSNSDAIRTEANLKRPCEGNQRSAKRKAVSPPPHLTPPWTSPAASDAGYSSCPLPGSSSERSVNGLSIERQVNCLEPALPTLENMSNQEMPNYHRQTAQRFKSPCVVAEQPSPYLERNSRKEAGRPAKRKSKNVSTSPEVVRDQFQAPELIFSSFGDLDKNQVLGERKLKCGKSTRASITNLENWCYFVTCGEHKHGLFIATKGFVYTWDKKWERVGGLMLPEGSVIYGDFDRDLNLFRIFDALRLGNKKLDDLDYEDRKQACRSFVNEGPNTVTTLDVADAKSLEDDDFREMLKRLLMKTGPHDVLFIRCHHNNSTFWSVMKNRLTWRCPPKLKLKEIIRKLRAFEGGLEFTEILCMIDI